MAGQACHGVCAIALSSFKPADDGLLGRGNALNFSEVGAGEADRQIEHETRKSRIGKWMADPATRWKLPIIKQTT
eukprot:11466042-Alexandrium_andersonii.AAC.1